MLFKSSIRKTFDNRARQIKLHSDRLTKDRERGFKSSLIADKPSKNVCAFLAGNFRKYRELVQEIVTNVF